MTTMTTLEWAKGWALVGAIGVLVGAFWLGLFVSLLVILEWFVTI